MQDGFLLEQPSFNLYLEEVLEELSLNLTCLGIFTSKLAERHRSHAYQICK